MTTDERSRPSERAGPAMSASLLDGESLAARVRAEVADRVGRLKGEGIEVGLGTILVGDDVRAPATWP